MGVKTVVLVRHAAVVQDQRHLWSGGVHDPACDPGELRRTAHRLAPVLAQYSPTHGLCSPMRRCRETCTALGLHATADERLRERNFGEWEGQPRDKLMANIDPYWLATTARWRQMPIPGAEAAEAVQARVAQVWKHICTLHGCVWVVAHGGTIAALDALATGDGLDEALARQPERGSWRLLEG